MFRWADLLLLLVLLPLLLMDNKMTPYSKSRASVHSLHCTVDVCVRVYIHIIPFLHSLVRLSLGHNKPSNRKSQAKQCPPEPHAITTNPPGLCTKALQYITYATSPSQAIYGINLESDANQYRTQIMLPATRVGYMYTVLNAEHTQASKYLVYNREKTAHRHS